MLQWYNAAIYAHTLASGQSKHCAGHTRERPAVQFAVRYTCSRC